MTDDRPFDDRSLIEMVAEFGQVSRLFQQETAFCEGVTFTQFLILDRIVQGGGRAGMSDLHAALQVDKSTTTRLVAPLLKRALVDKRRSAHDGRAFELHITSEGRAVTATVWDCISGAFSVVECHIPEGERQAAYRGVRVFLQALRLACADGCCTPAMSKEGCCDLE